MLVLSRRLHEQIIVGDDLVIEVTEIEKGKVRIGIACPRDVPIFRREILPKDHPHAFPERPEPVAT